MEAKVWEADLGSVPRRPTCLVFVFLLCFRRRVMESSPVRGLERIWRRWHSDRLRAFWHSDRLRALQLSFRCRAHSFAAAIHTLIPRRLFHLKSGQRKIVHGQPEDISVRLCPHVGYGIRLSEHLV